MKQKKRSELVLIGPPTAGKTTLALAFAKSLGMEYVGLDTVRLQIFEELNYDAKKADFLLKNKGFDALFEYWRPFECIVLEVCLNEFTDCVFDVGAGYVIQNEPDMIARTDQSLAPFSHIVQVGLSSDPKTTALLMKQRLSARDNLFKGKEDYTEIDAALIRIFSNTPVYSHYAHHTLYTYNRTVENCFNELRNYYQFGNHKL